MDKLTLRVNEPAVCALKFTEGIPVESQFGGDETMFSLVDGRRLFAPAPLKAAIEQAGVRRGQPIQIVKRSGSRFEVALVQGETETRPGANPTASSAYVPTHPRVPMTTQGNTPNYGAAIPAPPLEWQELEAAPAAPARANQSTLLMAAFLQAIDAISEAQAYAKRKDLGITFTSEDVRACAISIMIGAQKGGR